MYISLPKEMVPYSSVLAWRIPRTEEPGGLQSTGSPGVGHDPAHTHTLFPLEPLGEPEREKRGQMPSSRRVQVHRPLMMKPQEAGRSLMALATVLRGQPPTCQGHASREVNARRPQALPDAGVWEHASVRNRTTSRIGSA